jgi:hypothetical protein
MLRQGVYAVVIAVVSWSATARGAEPAEDVAPDVAFNEINALICKPDLGTAWNRMPPSYRRDLDLVKDAFVTQVDPQVWDRTMAVAGKLARVGKAKKDLLLGTTTFRALPPSERELVEIAYDFVFDALERMTSSKLKTYDGLRGTSLKDIVVPFWNASFLSLVEVSKKLELKLEDFIGITAKTEGIKYTLVKREGDTAVIRIEVPGEPSTEEAAMKVEGYWVYSRTAKTWGETMDKVRDGIALMGEARQRKIQYMEFLAVTDTALDRLLYTTNPASVDTQWKLYVMRVRPLMPRDVNTDVLRLRSAP